MLDSARERLDESAERLAFAIRDIVVRHHHHLGPKDVAYINEHLRLYEDDRRNAKREESES
jgi:hypothetical protein